MNNRYTEAEVWLLLADNLSEDVTCIDVFNVIERMLVADVIDVSCCVYAACRLATFVPLRKQKVPMGALALEWLAMEARAGVKP